MEQRLESIITAGKPWAQELRHSLETKLYKIISAATQAAPCILSVTAHGVPDGWPVWITGAQGMTPLNREPGPDHDRLGWIATVTGNPDAIELNLLNASRLPAYVADSARLEYFPPADLSTLSARWRLMQSDLDSGAALIAKTSGSGITLDNTAKLITISLASGDTASLVPGQRWQIFELFDGNGVIVARAEGPVRVAP